MEDVLYNAALLGNVGFLNDARNNEIESGSDEFFLKQTEHKNNILHLAIRREHFEFIEVILKGFISKQAIEELIKQPNDDGNTPIHVAAEVGNMDIFKLLHDYVSEPQTVQEDCSMIFMKMNGEGNIPLHVALIHDNVEVAKLLVENHPEMVSVTNNAKETPLHLATIHQPIDGPIKERQATSLANLEMIELLLEKKSCIALQRDAKGMTPLHRAASNTSAYNIQVIRLILDHCPQSAELRDRSNRTILHLLKTIPSYQQGKDLLGIAEVFDLRNHQDKQGNTPLHAAAMNMNLNMVRVLLDSSAKQSIRNKNGISAGYLIHEKFEINVEKNQMTMDVCEATNRANITYLKGRLEKFRNNFLFLRDSERRNVVHKLMQINNGTTIIQDEYVDFIRQVLESFPEFICQADLNGDTPVHILVRNSPDIMIRLESESKSSCEYLSELSKSNLVLVLLELCCTSFDRAQEEARAKGGRYDPPWLMQNKDGNTPLHEAFIVTQDEDVLQRLLELDIEHTAKLKNRLNQTPLHLFAGCPLMAYGTMDSNNFVEILVNQNSEAVYTQDKDGLTPFLKAVQIGNVKIVRALIGMQSIDAAIMLPDAKYGQTFWHMLVKHNSGYFSESIIKTRPNLTRFLIFKDYEGNTPLHLAIKNGRFDHAVNFLKKLGNDFKKKLLEQKNDAGITPSDLIRSAPEISKELDAILNDDLEFIGYRSVYGISTADKDKYVDTIGVIAALLMTVTFTAAFTVPGGQIQDIDNKDTKGTPILVNRSAFQAFMFFDISAMCLSTMVLFCLLWILAAGNKCNSVILMDFSILLLLISFYTTLLTFMTAVYATTIYVQPWIAIYTLIICSVLMLLMHKYLVVKYVTPIGPILSFYLNRFWRHLFGDNRNISEDLQNED